MEKLEVCRDRFKVNLTCQESSQGLLVTLHYDQERFAQGDMQRLLTHWHTVLLQVLACGGDVTIGDLQLLTHEEQY